MTALLKTTSLLLLVILAAPVSAEDEHHHHHHVDHKALELERTAIRERMRLWLQAIQNHQVEQTNSFYSTDAVLLPPNGPLLVTEKIAGHWKAFFSVPNMNLVLTAKRIDISDDMKMAYVVGLADVSGKRRQDRHKGKFLTVWKKAAGQWQIVADSLSLDLPVETTPRQ